MTRIYIAGPMSGLPDLNYPAFNAMAERLRAAGVLKLAYRKTIAVGCESPLARGISCNTARDAAFSIPATSYGGSDGMASAMPVTLRAPRPLTPIRAAAPCESGSAIVHKAQLEELFMTINPSTLCVKCGAADRGPDGRCKPCGKARAAAWRAANPERARANIADWEKANAEHLKAKKAEYRTANFAKEKAANAAWSAANPGKKKASAAAWRKANPEQYKANISAWNAANKDRLRVTRSAWSEANPEKCKASTAKWRAANPEQAKLAKHTRRAREKSAIGTLSRGLAEKLFELQKGMCPCCKQPLGDDYHLDHIIPLALGGPNTDDNIQLLRRRCNSQKCAKDPIDFMQSRGFLL